MTERLNASCRKILTELSAYLDGELDATACDAVERHCQTCARCASIVEGLRRTHGICRRAAALPLPPDVRARARTAVQRLLDQETAAE